MQVSKLRVVGISVDACLLVNWVRSSGVAISRLTAMKECVSRGNGIFDLELRIVEMECEQLLIW